MRSWAGAVTAPLVHSVAGGRRRDQFAELGGREIFNLAIITFKITDQIRIDLFRVIGNQLSRHRERGRLPFRQQHRVPKRLQVIGSPGCDCGLMGARRNEVA